MVPLGVHTWNLPVQYGGIGILFAKQTAGYTQNRVSGSYLDYNSIVTIAPEHLIITDTFFLGTSNIVLVAIPGKTTITVKIINFSFIFLFVCNIVSGIAHYKQRI